MVDDVAESSDSDGDEMVSECEPGSDTITAIFANFAQLCWLCFVCTPRLLVIIM